MSRKARCQDLDLTCRSPYRPAAFKSAAFKGLTEDRTRSPAHWFRNFLHHGRQPQKRFDPLIWRTVSFAYAIRFDGRALFEIAALLKWIFTRMS